MTYQQFLTEIQLQIHSLFDTDVTIQLHKIQKNNGVTLDGLTILRKGCNISPTIYLNDYYKEYQAGKIPPERYFNEPLNSRLTQTRYLNYLWEYYHQQLPQLIQKSSDLK